MNSDICYFPWGCCLPGTGPQFLQSPRDQSLASTDLCPLLNVVGLLTAKVSWRLQVPCLRCCTTGEVRVELNWGCFLKGYCSMQASRAASHCLCHSLWVNSGVASAVSWWTGWPGSVPQWQRGSRALMHSEFLFQPLSAWSSFCFTVLLGGPS